MHQLWTFVICLCFTSDHQNHSGFYKSSSSPRGKQCRPCFQHFLVLVKNAVIREVVEGLNYSSQRDSFAYVYYSQWYNLRGKVKVSELAFRLLIRRKAKILPVNQIKCLFSLFALFGRL